MRKSSLNIAYRSISDHFEHLPQKSFTEYDLRKLLNDYRSIWSIPKSITTKKFISFLIENNILISKEIKSADDKIKSLYIIPGFDNLTLFSALKKNAYFTHYSAMYLNGLTLQIPKTHYLNHEHYYDFDKQGLNQESIDEAFSKPQRKSKESYSIEGSKVFLINGKKNNRIGVVKRHSDTQSIYFTNVERTLIDIAIRPVYSGGVFEVLNAYKAAKEYLDISKLRNYLNNIDYIYPYHQSIGFYLDRAGYDQKDVKNFAKNIKFNFYLTYNIRKFEFDDYWRIFYPKGF